MKVLVTGTAGRIGRAIYIELMKSCKVIGLDKTPCSTADYIGDIRNQKMMRNLLEQVDVLVHTASLHAPHIGYYSDSEFNEINVQAVSDIAKICIEVGVKHIVYTSTTALYGYASTPANRTGWITEESTPQPKTIYHRTKIAAEKILESISDKTPITVLQMSRCFPEPADLMTLYRLTRGIDARDVASAHSLAIKKRLTGFNKFIISGKTPFNKSQCDTLYKNPEELFHQYTPEIVEEYRKRGWELPKSIDRVYDSSKAQLQLEWNPKHGYLSVLKMLDEGISEVLPVIGERE